MDLGVLEGQTRGDYFLNSIFDPSVKQCSAQALWDLIEKSESSKAAEIVSVISTVFVGVSIVGMTVNTMPDLQYEVDLK